MPTMLAALGLLLAGFFDLGQNAAAPAGEPAEHARAELLADVTAIEPGQTFRLGVRYAMDPEWHIYWKTAGDAGLATSVTLTLPEGFSAGELQWPVPERVATEGTLEIVTYTWHGEVILWTRVTAPENFGGRDSFTFGADSDWLVCKLECVPGEQKGMTLTLPAGEPQPSAAAAAFDTYEALTPLPGADQPLGLEVTGAEGPIEPGSGAELTLRLTPTGEGWRIDTAAAAENPDALAIYPLIPEAWEITHPGAETLEGEAAVFNWTVSPRFQATANDPAPEVVARAPLINAAGERRVAVAQFPLPLQVAGATSAAVAPTAAPPPSAPATDPAPAAAGLSFLSDRPNVEYPLWQMLLYAFIGGLILNVMPCVLPVISLKIMSFVRQSGEDPRRIFSLGLMFGAGVLGSFLVLSLAAIAFKAVVGETAGWGFQLQSPRVVIVLSAVLLALSLSLFGVFSIDLPGAATNKLAGAGGREGYGGAFFNGILATILSTPCSAPFLGTAIGFAMFQPAPVIVLFFLVVGLGLATPYVLLSANPRWLRFLPKPGGWMETFKQVMAFPMLAVLAWLIWVLGGQAGNDSVAMALAFLIAVGFACWLIGRYEYRNTRARRIAVVSALALVIAGYFFFPERHLQAMASLAAAEPAGKAAQAPEEWANGIEWEPFSVAAVERLTADNRTVFLDFTADWCTTCKFFEGTVLNTDRVAELFSRYDVAPVKADWTRRDPVIGQVLAQFGKAGVPLYVILPAGRPEDAIVMDAISADRIEKGLAQAAGEQAVATR